jgi:hypothetical protein
MAKYTKSVLENDESRHLRLELVKTFTQIENFIELNMKAQEKVLLNYYDFVMKGKMDANAEDL